MHTFTTWPARSPDALASSVTLIASRSFASVCVAAVGEACSSSFEASLALSAANRRYYTCLNSWISRIDKSICMAVRLCKEFLPLFICVVFVIVAAICNMDRCDRCWWCMSGCRAGFRVVDEEILEIMPDDDVALGQLLAKNCLELSRHRAFCHVLAALFRYLASRRHGRQHAEFVSQGIQHMCDASNVIWWMLQV